MFLKMLNHATGANEPQGQRPEVGSFRTTFMLSRSILILNCRFPKLPDGSRDLDKSWSYQQTWKEMEKVLKTGKVKAIGVANFSVKFLEELLPEAEVTPAVNQIENHPYLPQQEIVDFCKSKGIHVTAYSPFGSTGSPLFQEEGIQEVAKKHSVSAGTVLLSYGGQYPSHQLQVSIC